MCLNLLRLKLKSQEISTSNVNVVKIRDSALGLCGFFFLESLSAEGLIHGELIGQLIGVFSLVSFLGEAICGGLSTRGAFTDFYGMDS